MILFTAKDFSDITWNLPELTLPLVNIKKETHITKKIDDDSLETKTI